MDGGVRRWRQGWSSTIDTSVQLLVVLLSYSWSHSACVPLLYYCTINTTVFAVQYQRYDVQVAMMLLL